MQNFIKCKVYIFSRSLLIVVLLILPFWNSCVKYVVKQWAVLENSNSFIIHIFENHISWFDEQRYLRNIEVRLKSYSPTLNKSIRINSWGLLYRLLIHMCVLYSQIPTLVVQSNSNTVKKGFVDVIKVP